MPVRVRAFCHFGKWHNIETEDDVTAYFEFPNGATGAFVTTTADAPGTNRLEILCSRGKVVCEKDTLTVYRLKEDAAYLRREAARARAAVNAVNKARVTATMNAKRTVNAARKTISAARKAIVAARSVSERPPHDDYDI